MGARLNKDNALNMEWRDSICEALELTISRSDPKVLLLWDFVRGSYSMNEDDGDDVTTTLC